MAIILGIDPGSRKTGFGLIETGNSPEIRYISSGVIRLEHLTTFPERLALLFSSLQQLILEHSPDQAAIEEVFLGKNASSALKLGQARGAAIVSCTHSGLIVSEYAARKVKQAIAGSGNASKDQMGHMIKTLLSLPGIPQEDAADALAIALCHFHSQTSLSRVSGAIHSRRGRLVEKR